MAAKKIAFGTEARGAIRNGVKKLARASVVYFQEDNHSTPY